MAEWQQIEQSRRVKSIKNKVWLPNIHCKQCSDKCHLRSFSSNVEYAVLDRMNKCHAAQAHYVVIGRHVIRHTLRIAIVASTIDDATIRSTADMSRLMIVNTQLDLRYNFEWRLADHYV